jgi:hypothetical protein
MAATEQETKQAGQGLSSSSALKAARAAAATGAAAYAVQRALAGRGRDGSENGDGESDGGRSEGGGGGGLLASAAAGGWEAARDTLLPLAEEAATAAGRFMAEHGPEFVNERLLPRFIEAFNDAQG